LAIVSHSEVESFILCGRRHYYAHGEKLQKKVLSESLRRGLDGHSNMEYFFKHLTNSNSWDSSMRELQGHMTQAMLTADEDGAKEVTKLMGLIVGFLNYYKQEILSWELVAVEEEYQVEAEPGVKFGFKPDLLIKVGGYIEPVDWKFTYDFYQPAVQAILPQLPKYMWALREMGYPVRRGRYGFLRYRSLKNNPPPSARFRIDSVPFNKVRDKRTYDEWIDTCYEINTLKRMNNLIVWEKEVKRVANALVCKSCSFKELCGADLVGVGGDNIRREMYVPNTYGYVERDD
jgi:CRISPR/Cas system-associated exonuclease Cas4 (RecB family)